jgi:hypothetical protein
VVNPEIVSKRLWWGLLLLFYSGDISAQFLRRPLAAGGTGLGAYSQSHSSVFSFTTNQGALARLEKTAMAVYGERKYLLRELNYYTAVIGLPAGPGNFGWKAAYAGFSDYNESQLGLAYARSLGKKLDAGLQFNYNHIRIASGYGSAAAFTVELGVLLHISEKLHTGIHIDNPAGGKFGKNGEERFGSVYSFGMGYEASEKFFVSAEISKEEDRPVNVNAGMQYRFIPLLLVKGGIATATSSGWLGAGFTKGNLHVEIITQYHPQLGITPGLMLQFEWQKKKK